MIYFDYSATAPLLPAVQSAMSEAAKTYIGNANSHYALGFQSKAYLDQLTQEIQTILKIEDHDLIFTSGASESNNMVVQTMRRFPKEKCLITTPLEHPSMIAPLSVLQHEGYRVEFVGIDRNGQVDLAHLEALLQTSASLVSIVAMDSETGCKQDLKAIADVVHRYPEVLFHSDVTQALGKMDLDLTKVDYASMSAHKLGGPIGIGLLIHRRGCPLTNLIYGGTSLSRYRSSTPPLMLIAGLACSLQETLGQRDNKIQVIHQMLRDFLSGFEGVMINSPIDCSPYILNFSWISQDSHRVQAWLSDHEVYVSLKSACSMDDVPSQSVLALTQDPKRALTSVRLSFSKQTTLNEAKQFKSIFRACYQQLEEHR